MPDRHASTATLPSAPEGDSRPAGAASRRVQVLLPLPLSGAYDYLVPEGLAPEGLAVEPGSVVVAPLAQRELIGVVWDQRGDSDSAAAPVPSGCMTGGAAPLDEDLYGDLQCP